ncbi:hypothetical protein TNCV_537781 [Trichonephila clavipes]|nr:hypothetical protein TNCV_537781 [Trichonephila clavipes]
MECPTSSPDLKPIDNMRNMLRKRLTALCNPLLNLNDLTACLPREGELIPKREIDKLLVSRNRQCRARIFSKGGVPVLQKNPEGSELAIMVANDAKMVTNDAKMVAKVAKNDASLALPPRFHQVLIELPL